MGPILGQDAERDNLDPFKDYDSRLGSPVIQPRGS